MRKLPLIFSFTQLVHGNGFIAGVRMTGRVLLVEGNGETWLNGVEPAGLAGGGVDRAAAFQDFHKNWVEVLFDIAQEARTFEEFDLETKRFLGTKANALTEEWNEALSVQRAEGYRDPTLPVVDPEQHPVYFEVCELAPATSRPTKNEVRVELPLAFAA